MLEATEPAREPEVRLVDARQAGKMLGLGRTSIFSLVAAGELHPLRLGRVNRFRIDEIDQLIRRASEGTAIKLGYRPAAPAATAET